MNAKYYNESKKCFNHCKSEDYKYASFIDYVIKYGINAGMHPSVISSENTPDDTAKETIQTPEYTSNHDIYSERDGFAEPVISYTEEVERADTTQLYIKNIEKPESKDSAGCQDKRTIDEEGLYGRGLFHYRKWWKQSEVDIFVNGSMLTGIPIFTDKNTLRVVNDAHSYFIPLEKVDYIRTTDGLKSCSGSETVK